MNIIKPMATSPHTMASLQPIRPWHGIDGGRKIQGVGQGSTAEHYDDMMLTFLAQQQQEQLTRVENTNLTQVALKVMLQLSENHSQHHDHTTIQNQQLLLTLNHYITALEHNGASQVQQIQTLQAQLMQAIHREEIHTATQAETQLELEGNSTLTPEHPQGQFQGQTPMTELVETLQRELKRTEEVLQRQTMTLHTSTLRLKQIHKTHTIRRAPFTPVIPVVSTANPRGRSVPVTIPQRGMTVASQRAQTHTIEHHKNQLLTVLHQVDAPEGENIWRTLRESPSLTLRQQTFLEEHSHLTPMERVEQLLIESNQREYTRILQVLKQGYTPALPQPTPPPLPAPVSSDSVQSVQDDNPPTVVAQTTAQVKQQGTEQRATEKTVETVETVKQTHETVHQVTQTVQEQSEMVLVSPQPDNAETHLFSQGSEEYALLEHYLTSISPTQRNALMEGLSILVPEIVGTASHAEMEVDRPALTHPSVPTAQRAGEHPPQIAPQTINLNTTPTPSALSAEVRAISREIEHLTKVQTQQSNQSPARANDPVQQKVVNKVQSSTSVSSGAGQESLALVQPSIALPSGVGQMSPIVTHPNTALSSDGGQTTQVPNQASAQAFVLALQAPVEGMQLGEIGRLTQMIAQKSDLPTLLQHWQTTPAYEALEAEQLILRRLTQYSATVDQRHGKATAELLRGLSESEGRVLLQHLKQSKAIPDNTPTTGKALRTLRKVLAHKDKTGESTKELVLYLNVQDTPVETVVEELTNLYETALTQKKAKAEIQAQIIAQTKAKAEEKARIQEELTRRVTEKIQENLQQKIQDTLQNQSTEPLPQSMTQAPTEQELSQIELTHRATPKPAQQSTPTSDQQPTGTSTKHGSQSIQKALQPMAVQELMTLLEGSSALPQSIVSHSRRALPFQPILTNVSLRQGVGQSLQERLQEKVPEQLENRPQQSMTSPPRAPHESHTSPQQGAEMAVLHRAISTIQTKKISSVIEAVAPPMVAQAVTRAKRQNANRQQQQQGQQRSTTSQNLRPEQQMGYGDGKSLQYVTSHGIIQGLSSPPPVGKNGRVDTREIPTTGELMRAPLPSVALVQAQQNRITQSVVHEATQRAIEMVSSPLHYSKNQPRERLSADPWQDAPPTLQLSPAQGRGQNQQMTENVVKTTVQKVVKAEVAGKIPPVDYANVRNQAEVIAKQEQNIAALQKAVQIQEETLQKITSPADRPLDTAQVQKLARAVMKEMDGQIRLERQRRGLI